MATKGMLTNKRGLKLPLQRVIDAVTRDDMTGFCLNCGAEQDSCEPDARKYHCESCLEYRVYGAEQILIMAGIGA